MKQKHIYQVRDHLRLFHRWSLNIASLLSIFDKLAYLLYQKPIVFKALK